MSGHEGLHVRRPRAFDDSALLSPPQRSPPFSKSVPLSGLPSWFLHDADDRRKLGSDSLLRRTSIPTSDVQNDPAVGPFKGPLLLSVRRVNSSPASSKPGSRDAGEGNAKPSAVGTEYEHIEPSPVGAKNEPITIATGTSSSVDSSQGHPGLINGKFLSPEKNFTRTNSRHGSREDIELSTPNNSTPSKFANNRSNSSNIDCDSSTSSPSLQAWRHRLRTEAGSDFPFMPLTKSQRITADHSSRLDRLNIDQSNNSLLESEKSVANTSSQFVIRRPSSQHMRRFSKDSAAIKSSQHHSSGPKLVDEKVSGMFLDNGPSISLRRRRGHENSSSRQSTDAWLSEIRPPMPASASSAEEDGSALKPVPMKQVFFLGWPADQSKLAFRNMFVFLLLFICTSSVLYSVVQHHQLTLLKRENLRLKAAVGGFNLDSTRSVEDHEEVFFAKVTWKLFFAGGLVLLLCGPYSISYCWAVSYWRRKSHRNGTEEDIPLGKRVAYLVDVLFSTHSYAKAMALLLATLLLIGLGGCSLYAVGDEDLSDSLWRSWTYVADSGNHADSMGLGPRIVSVGISIGGMLIFALMLGLVSDAISEKVDLLRKGRSEVVESGHTLILGWSDKLGSLLKQLAIANKSLGGSVVVVLAERDKEEMELDIAKLEFDLMGTSVICRSGSPLIMADLKKVSVSKARSIVVLAEVENADQSDARALRVVLSLTAVKEGLKGHIVVELSDLDNEPLVKLVGGNVVETVVGHDVIGRLMIQCARQPGLAQIWEDILGFDKAEFYLKRWPQLDGMQFKHVLVSFPEAIPCGIKVAGDEGRIILNPDGDYVLCEGDEVLVIAEDDDTYAPASLPKLLCGSLPKVLVPPIYPEKILFCGWRRDIHDMIKVLDAFLPSGSELWIFSDVSLEERKKKLKGENLDRLEHIILQHRQGNPVIRRHLESLPLQTFDSILILADEKLEENVVIADSRSLATLLLIRDIQSKRLPCSVSKGTQMKRPGFVHGSWIGEMQQASDKSIIISEILDSRTKHLVSVSQIGDYVLSNELVSMALAMVAEEKQINRVLEELFAEEGNELYIRSGEFYLYEQEELSFFDIMMRAHQRREIVVGYRRSAQERAIINPPDKMVSQKWSVADVFIVLGVEERANLLINSAFRVFGE